MPIEKKKNAVYSWGYTPTPMHRYSRIDKKGDLYLTKIWRTTGDRHPFHEPCGHGRGTGPRRGRGRKMSKNLFTWFMDGPLWCCAASPKNLDQWRVRYRMFPYSALLSLLRRSFEQPIWTEIVTSHPGPGTSINNVDSWGRGGKPNDHFIR